MKIPESDVEAPPNVFEEGEVRYVTGIGKRKGRLVVLIDLTKILQKGELRRISETVEAQTATITL
jgi:chemotaxis signal transduction protein